MWTNRIGFSRSHLDRLFCRPVDRSCPLSKVTGYTDHNFVICVNDRDRINIQSPEHWNLNASFPVRQCFSNQDSKLIYRDLAGVIVNSSWRIALKRAITIETIGFSQKIVSEESRIDEGLVKKLEEARLEETKAK